MFSIKFYSKLCIKVSPYCKEQNCTCTHAKIDQDFTFRKKNLEKKPLEFENVWGWV